MKLARKPGHVGGPKYKERITMEVVKASIRAKSWVIILLYNINENYICGLWIGIVQYNLDGSLFNLKMRSMSFWMSGLWLTGTQIQ